MAGPQRDLKRGTAVRSHGTGARRQGGDGAVVGGAARLPRHVHTRPPALGAGQAPLGPRIRSPPASLQFIPFTLSHYKNPPLTFLSSANSAFHAAFASATAFRSPAS